MPATPETSPGSSAISGCSTERSGAVISNRPSVTRPLSATCPETASLVPSGSASNRRRTTRPASLCTSNATAPSEVAPQSAWPTCSRKSESRLRKLDSAISARASTRGSGSHPSRATLSSARATVTERRGVAAGRFIGLTETLPVIRLPSIVPRRSETRAWPAAALTWADKAAVLPTADGTMSRPGGKTGCNHRKVVRRSGADKRIAPSKRGCTVPSTWPDIVSCASPGRVAVISRNRIVPGPTSAAARKCRSVPPASVAALG